MEKGNKGIAPNTPKGGDPARADSAVSSHRGTSAASTNGSLEKRSIPIPKYVTKQILPSDETERQRILDAIDNEEERNHLYTRETLDTIQGLLVEAEDAIWKSMGMSSNLDSLLFR